MVQDGCGKMFDLSNMDNSSQYYTNTIQLRDRKPDSCRTKNRFLTKVAKFGEYELPFWQFSAKVPRCLSIILNNKTVQNKQGFQDGRNEPAIEKNESNPKCDGLRRHGLRRSKVYKWRGRTIVRSTTTSLKSRRRLSLQTWRANMLSSLSGYKKNPRKIKHLVWSGVPSSIRNEFWSAFIGNHLDIDQTIFDRCVQLIHQCSRSDDQSTVKTSIFENQGFFVSTSQLSRECSVCDTIFSHVNSAPIRQEVCSPYLYSLIDGTLNFCCKPNNQNRSSDCRDRSVCLTFVKRDVSLTFSSLRLFQVGCPFHAQLHDVLAAYLAYQPQIGYVPGMSFLAAVLLLVVGDTFSSFVLFANLLDRPCHRAFYAPDESEFVIRCRAFNQLLSDRAPQLYRHFVRVGLEPNMYLFDWLFCIFSRSLPLDAVLRVWDLYCFKGEIILFRAALTLLVYFQTELLSYDLDRLMIFLARPLPLNLTGEQLVKRIASTHLKRRIWSLYLNGSRANLLASKREQQPVCPASGQKDCTVFHSNSKTLEPFAISSSNNEYPSLSNFTTVHPALVDHSTRSLYSCDSTTSLDSVGVIRHQATDQLTSTLELDSKTTPIYSDSDEKIPWTADLRASSYPSTVFTFDRLPLSAPSDVQTFTMGRKRPTRCWTSDCAVSSHFYADRMEEISQVTSAHELGHPTFCATPPKFKSILSRSRSTLFSHSPLPSNHANPCSINVNPITTKLFPIELIP